METTSSFEINRMEISYCPTRVTRDSKGEVLFKELNIGRSKIDIACFPAELQKQVYEFVIKAEQMRYEKS